MHNVRNLSTPFATLGFLLLLSHQVSCSDTNPPTFANKPEAVQASKAQASNGKDTTKDTTKVAPEPPAKTDEPASEPAENLAKVKAPVAAVAQAATDATQQTWWQALLYDITFNLVVPVFVPVLGALLFVLLRKWGLKVELETLDKIGKNAAEYSEHKAKVWLKETGYKSSAARKEDWAWDLVEAINTKFKAKQKVRQKLRAIILANITEAERKAQEASNPSNPPPTPLRGPR